MSHHNELTDQQKDDAAIWYARQAGGSMSSRQQAEFQAWLNADEGNRAAFEEMRQLWTQLEQPASRLAKQERSAWRRIFGPFVRPVARPFSIGMAAAVILVAVCALWSGNPWILQNLRADIVAGPDVTSRFQLPDGSSVILAANSAVTTDFDGDRRRVELLRGQAFFNVVSRHGDPFTVTSGEASVRVVGTRFSVDQQSAGTVVTVEEGRVQVAGWQKNNNVEIGPGQQVSVLDGALETPRQVNPVLALSWLKGRLSVENVRVADLVAQFARYQNDRIMVLGDLADRRISGTFTMANIPGSLQTMADALDAKLVRVSPWMTVIY
ncbi:FecR domain-containing protein [Thalassospira sp. TSL5-1]|uniref:FecR family protein n=1 Tax=Thalassospira sp. TSL5-1 TaxID=1544451 RepID=UPI00093A43A5|nr:FecR domain-containing protein [Thalassospira sp. TSL5-1]OKH86824.1 hypothetical protein LF95_20715 [Thalassospira sp. TSL5-1]